MPAADWRFLCPACSDIELDEQGYCPACSARYATDGGVLLLLSAQRRAEFSSFLAGYSRIRAAEGRGSADSKYYRNLPLCPGEHPLADQWRIRARSFRVLSSLLTRELGIGARVLDLGAGCGWLSHSLAAQGMRPCAIDINLDEQDGLRASRHFAATFPCVEAEFDDLPVPTAIADAAVFNASLHYSVDLDRTFREVLRTVRPGGLLAVVDSPVYRDAASGQRMVVEQHADFESRFGDRSDRLASIGFLTFADFDRLASRFGLTWSVSRPWYGWRWAVRPAIARALGQREPATFAVFYARRPPGGSGP